MFDRVCKDVRGYENLGHDRTWTGMVEQIKQKKTL